jgi:oligopeptide/dipeptide ABC transporter ATP-binding protein
MAARDLLLEVKGLKSHFFTDEGVVRAVDGVDFTLERGKTLCLVGESGCGKSVTAFSILQLVGKPGRIVEGEILYYRRSDPRGPTEIIDLASLAPQGREMRAIRGQEIGMIFQEPMASLSPVHTIGRQIIEPIRYHLNLGKEEAQARAVEMLRRVGISRPESRIDDYPFQLSGGMRQRAMIAIALSCGPALLIADEPTTALDVTTQAQILDLIRELQAEFGMAVMLITHDLGVVAEMADDVVVMYLGQVAERGDVRSIFRDPKHPYTRALLRSIPKVGLKARKRLEAIRGMVPGPYQRPPGCTFHPRCTEVIAGLCDHVEPPAVTLGEGCEVRCLLYRGETAAEPAITTNAVGVR